MKRLARLLLLSILTCSAFTLRPAYCLDNAFVYPNPYRPDSGTTYDNTSVGEGIVFAGMPSSAKIRIFTISGEFVNEINQASQNGRILWDTCNADGQKIASGTYIFIATSSAIPGKKTCGRFAIIR